MPFSSGLPLASSARLLLCLLLVALPACRKGGQTRLSTTFTIQTDGNSGCLFAGPNLAAPTLENLFGPGGLAGRVDGPLSDPATRISLSPFAGAAAFGTANRVYLACDDPSIRVLDLDSETITTLVDEAEFAAFDAGVLELGGIAILDANTLLVMERSLNTILAVDRTTGLLSTFAGLPNAAGGFADGFAIGGALFSFEGLCGLAVDGRRRVIVADSGNHRLRIIQGSTVSTLAGSGVPGYFDSTGPRAQLEAPSGVAIGCDGTLFFTERGQHLRQIVLTTSRNGLTANVITRVGNGISASIDGTGAPNGSASVFDPVAPMTLPNGDVLWVDHGSGHQRWLLGLVNAVTTPLPAFSADGIAAAVVTADDSLLLFDAVNGAIVRVR